MYFDPDAELLLRRTALAGREAASDTAVVLVICVKGMTRLRRDYGRHSIATGFYSAQELDDIISAFRSIGCYVQHFADEVDFIEWVNAGGHRELSHSNKFVYIGSVNGTGPGRRCLLPSFCALEGIDTLNSDAYSSAINRHKFHWTKLLGSFGVGVPQSWLFEVGSGWLNGEAPFPGKRVIAKALHEDSSIGISGAGVGEWSPAIEQHVEIMAAEFRQPIMVQEFISGSEVEVPVLQLGASRIAAPVLMLNNDGTDLGDDFLSYDLVWDDRYGFAEPSFLGPEVCKRLVSTAVKVCEMLNFRYLSRVDFRIDSEGKEHVIDVSTTPHLTRHSSYDHLFSGVGLEYADVPATLIGAGIANLQSSAQY
jgi:D-alanine-D-alanine ligase